MQTLNTETGTQLGCVVENQQVDAVVRRGESVNHLDCICFMVGKRYVDLFRRSYG
jgi:hypothetical protein